MAVQIWRGDAPAVAQQTRVTPANVEIGDVFRLTINGKTISFTATVATAANVNTGLATAWLASTAPEFIEILAMISGGDLLLTAKTSGVPFVVTAATVDGGSSDTQTLTINTTVAASGPNFWSVSQNWSTGSVPTAGDDIYLVNSAVDILYGLDQSAVAPTTLNVEQSYTGRIGLPRYNPAGYAEYRDQYLRLIPSVVNIGRGLGSGSSRIKLDTVSTAVTLNVFNTGRGEDATASVIWKGTSTSNALNVFRVSMEIATGPAETATLGSLRIVTDPTNGVDAVVTLGAGVTVSTKIEKTGGSLRFAGVSLADLVQHDGITTIEAGNVAAVTVRGGTVFYNSTGTLAGAVVSAAGKLDFSRDLRSKIVAAPIEIFGSSARVNDPFKVVGSLVLDLNETNIPGLDIGTNIRVSRGAVG